MFQLRKYTAGRFRLEEGLLQAMFEIVAPSYVDVRELFHKETSFCDTVYLGECDGKVCSFFLVQKQHLSWKGTTLLGVYLGLSAAAPRFKGSGVIRLLYQRCLRDLEDDEFGNCSGGFLWGTTATPTVFVAASRHLSDVQPRSDGTYSSDGAELAVLLKREFADWGWVASLDQVHPFVLKAVIKARYSEAELTRIKNVSRRFNLFERLGVRESQGDRLIFLAPHPKAPTDSFALETSRRIGGS